MLPFFLKGSACVYDFAFRLYENQKGENKIIFYAIMA